MGDCAERFIDCTGEIIESKVGFLQKCASILEKGLQKPILKLSRIAGQYAKPRSADYETVNGEEVLSYRGDSVNDIKIDGRKHDPKRMTECYLKSATTLNYLRAITPNDQIFVSHEGLLLEYESALTRKCNDKFYDLSGHFIWTGERTRNLEQGHMNFYNGVENPIGIKIGAVKSEEEFLTLSKRLNPNNETGKLVIIIRFGVKKIQDALPKLIEIKQKHKLNFTWVSDPMHGNTFTANGFKTREYSTLLDEIVLVNQLLKQAGEKLGGIHLESTPDDVTECLGGKNEKIVVEDLPKCYTSYCDPRLNHNQCLDLIQDLIPQLKDI